ncbi:MAG TPA: hypothetical protein PLR20_02070 [Syntrophales bacterium]|nr:hypothetical protein [Syntrophales bacterium]HQM28117.1 hypothetical protein [Syntrophales bacterium]
MIGCKEKDHRSLLKNLAVISLMFIWIVLLMTYSFSFFDFISKQQMALEEGYMLAQSEVRHILADRGVLEQGREKVTAQPSDAKDGLSTQEKNVLSSYILFGKALRGFQRDGKKGEFKNR